MMSDKFTLSVVNLSYEKFAREYLFANKPVVVTDALRSWKALTRWTPEFFKREFGAMKFTLDEDLRTKIGYRDGGGAVEYTMARFIDRVLKSTDASPAPYFRNQILCDFVPCD